MAKSGTSFRLSEEARKLIDGLTAHLGISQAGVIEMAVRELARQHGVQPEKEAESQA